MKTYKLILAVMIGGLLALGSLSSEGQEHQPYAGSEAFERLKQLVGSWEGMMDAGKGPEKITASYKLTSGGSALVETVFEGTPHEMVSVYHDNPDRQLTMTHYCMLHNQPKMVLKDMKKNQLKFDLAKDADIDVAKEAHMHSLSITFDGNDKMIQQWTEFKDGMKSKGVNIDYKRIE